MRGSHLTKKAETQFESKMFLILLNWHIYTYLRTFRGTEPPLISLRETLCQGPLINNSLNASELLMSFDQWHVTLSPLWENVLELGATM